jgi:hypothetical protein
VRGRLRASVPVKCGSPTPAPKTIARRIAAQCRPNPNPVRRQRSVCLSMIQASYRFSCLRGSQASPCLLLPSRAGRHRRSPRCRTWSRHSRLFCLDDAAPPSVGRLCACRYQLHMARPHWSEPVAKAGIIRRIFSERILQSGSGDSLFRWD